MNYSPSRRFLFAIRVSLLAVVALANMQCTSSSLQAQTPAGLKERYDIRAYGARGDGKTLDTNAINKTIDAAAAAGGGTVYFPPGDYLTASIRLKSNICLYIDHAATIVAVDPGSNPQATYDKPEPNPAGMPDPKHPYQDFGHCHWHNSLIWGDNITNVAIVGTGTIWGKGLTRNNDAKDNHGNKSISLKLCRNVTLRDFTIKHGGWFGILATGVDNMAIDNLTIDTNRDGMDLDCCRKVRVSNCLVNSPYDDGICPKSSYALGEARPCEEMTITNCQVSGYAEGSLLDGTCTQPPDKADNGTGRIKCGTESNGGFKNIAISNCTFVSCHGFALESEDGALLENITISNITMRDIYSAPIFIRLGSRMRGPDGVPVGEARRIMISNIVCYAAGPRQGCIISGIPGHDVEDVKVSNLTVYYRGGGTQHDAERKPPEEEAKYPDPDMFGELPAYGFYIRHAKGIQLENIDFHTIQDDARPAFMLEDVKGADFRNVQSQRGQDTPEIVLKDVSGLLILDCKGIADTAKEKIESGKF